MSLLKKITRSQVSNSELLKGLYQLFHSEIERSDHPYRMALHTYDQLVESSQSQEETFLYMIEDVIFTSIYATFYEHVLFTAKDNKLLAKKLIECFEQDANERESLIAKQTQEHLNFILNEGQCNGCASCDNHSDVSELIEFVQDGNYEFFKNLYIGMNTIQYSMEEIIYDHLGDNLDWLDNITSESILEYRKMIIDFVENKNAC